MVGSHSNNPNSCRLHNTNCEMALPKNNEAPLPSKASQAQIDESEAGDRGEQSPLSSPSFYHIETYEDNCYFSYCKHYLGCDNVAGVASYYMA